MRAEPISIGYLNFRSDESNKEKTTNVSTPIKTTELPKKSTLPLITAAVAIASLGVSAYAVKGRSKSKALEESKKLAEEAKTKAENAASEAKKAAEEKVKELENKVTDLTSKVNSNESTRAEKQKWNEGYLDGLNRKVENLQSQPVVVQASQTRWLHKVDNFNLIQNPTPLDSTKAGAKAIEKIRTAADKFIYGKAAIPVLGAGATVWLPTAESLPEKEGGLGEVPVQMAKNMDTELGINNYIVRPLMEIPGKSTLIEKEGQYYYWYEGLKDADGNNNVPMKVEKVVDFNIDTVRNGQYETQKVEVFYGVDPANGFKRIMFRNPDYFTAPGGLYEPSLKSEEAERYNFFSKAVYEFAKLTADPKSKTSYNIYNEDSLKEIKTPDAMVLNDWHTAPIAAMMRLLAPAEAANKELNSTVADTFENMNLMYIVHNSGYQGWGNRESSDMLNTLFGKYTYDIYQNAKTGFTEEYKDESGRTQTKPIDSLSNVLTIDGSVNMANMGMALATKVKPVSKTYSEEIANEVERGGALTHISHERMAAGTMQGQSNGWDRSVNEFSEKNIKGFPKEKLNEDKYGIFKYTMSNLKGLSADEKKKVAEVLKENINQKNFENISIKMLDLGIPAVTEQVNKFTRDGLFNLRSFVPVTSDMPLDKILEGQRHNKRVFVESLKAMIDFNKQHGNDNSVFKFNVCEYTDLSDITEDNIDDIPVFNMGVRFVDQKGVPIVAKAWENILNDWDTLYPGKPRPLVLIGGVDAEGGIHSNTIDDTKISLKEKGNHLVHLDGFTPNPVWMGASNWTMRPSKYEPDGDKWESLYKGVPAVMTRVGGHIDSIKDGNGLLTKSTMAEIRTKLRKEQDPNKPLKPEELEAKVMDEVAKEYTDVLKQCLEIYYGGVGQLPHSSYVDKAIHGNQSWVQKDEKGKIVDCPIIGHVKDLGFDLSKFDQVSETLK